MPDSFDHQGTWLSGESWEGFTLGEHGWCSLVGELESVYRRLYDDHRCRGRFRYTERARHLG